MRNQNGSGPCLQENPGMGFWDEINKHLDKLSSEEIIERYYSLRDQQKGTNNYKTYPNMKHLHATSFERRKDCLEQQKWQERQKTISEVVQWYQEAKNKPREIEASAAWMNAAQGVARVLSGDDRLFTIRTENIERQIEGRFN